MPRDISSHLQGPRVRKDKFGERGVALFATVQQVAGYIEELAPPALALPGDPVGLQVGDPHAAVQNCLLYTSRCV